MKDELIDQDELKEWLLRGSTNVCFPHLGLESKLFALKAELRAGVITKEEFDEALDSLHIFHPEVRHVRKLPVEVFKKCQ